MFRVANISKSHVKRECEYRFTRIMNIQKTCFSHTFKIHICIYALSKRKLPRNTKTGNSTDVAKLSADTTKTTLDLEQKEKRERERERERD